MPDTSWVLLAFCPEHRVGSQLPGTLEVGLSPPLGPGAVCYVATCVEDSWETGRTLRVGVVSKHCAQEVGLLSS